MLTNSPGTGTIQLSLDPEALRAVHDLIAAARSAANVAPPTPGTDPGHDHHHADDAPTPNDGGGAKRPSPANPTAPSAAMPGSLAAAVAQMNSTLTAIYQQSLHQTALAGGVVTTPADPTKPIAELTDFIKSQRHLNDFTAIASNLGFHGVAGTATRVGGFAQGLHDAGEVLSASKIGGRPGAAAGGAMKGIGALASRAAIPLAVAKEGIDTAAKTANILHDPHTTGEQKARAFFREVVPGGETLQRWNDQFTGREHKMASVHEQAMYRGIEMQRRVQETRFGIESNPHISGLTSFADTYRRQSAALAPVMDRSTASGEQQYRLAMKILPLRQETLRTERELAKATAERRSSSEEEIELAKKIKGITGWQQAIRPTLDSGSGPELLERQEKYARNARELGELARTRQDVVTRSAEARNREAVAQADYSKAKTREELGTRRETAQNLADRSRSGAQALGAIPYYMRGDAVKAVRDAKQYGLDSIPEQFRGFVSQLDPHGYDEMLRKTGESDPGYKQLQDAGVQNFPRGPKRFTDYQREADQAEHDIGKKENTIDADAARKLADIAHSVTPFMIEAMKVYAEAQKQDFLAETRKGKERPR
jgi:hypothetical protein